MEVFARQAPGQTANNEGLMDCLHPTRAEMLPRMLSSRGPL